MSDIDPSYYRYGEALLVKKRKVKREMAVVALLWLVGCPILCYFTEESNYGKPDKELCGLTCYSISASMTGQLPKIFGSIMAPLFAKLVVQRTCSGLCAHLKLGWLVRFSPLINGNNQHIDEKTRNLASRFWQRILRIEFLGYLTMSNLVLLVALDAKNFMLAHIFFAQLAFFSLLRQNLLIGRLGDDFPDLLPNWPCQRANFMFRWGMLHFGIMCFGFMFFGTLNNRGRCDVIFKCIDAFGDPATVRWLFAVLYWFNEYFFVFLCVYVQLLQHYEMQLWEFVGATNMPYTTIVSRYSIGGSIEHLLGRESDDAVLLGMKQKSS